MYFIVIVHELGHIIIALIFNYKIKKINIYPFGGYTVFEHDLNISFIKEFMLFLGGILFQVIMYLIIHNTIDNSLYIYKVYVSYNTSILLFNMIPIIPLDGGKLLNILVNKFLPFKISHKISIFISYTLIILVIIIFRNSINFILMMALLLALVVKEDKSHRYIFNMFLIERYIKDLKFKQSKIIVGKDVNKMYKYVRCIFAVNNRYLEEKEVLKDYYKN